jgi:hypothetical protein
VESSPGYHLITHDSPQRPVDNVTSSECSRLLLSQREIRSSQFLPPARKDLTGYVFDGVVIENDPRARGKCILNWENKFTRPEAYRVANVEVHYKESQCVEDCKWTFERCQNITLQVLIFIFISLHNHQKTYRLYA